MSDPVSFGIIDTDGDGVSDGNDLDPLDPTICRDVDVDSCDDCAVTRAPPDPLDDGDDLDGDGLCDVGDPDIDGDTVPNLGDDDPLDPSVCQDLDAESCDDCSVTAGLPDVADDGPDLDGDTAATALLNLRPSHELRWGIGAGIPLAERQVEIQIEWAGSTVTAPASEGWSASPFDPVHTPNELLIAGQFSPKDGPVWFKVEAGRGFGPGFGSTDLRVFAQVGVERRRAAPKPPPDRDGDGIVDASDACPDVAEDVDGWQDEDGCADPTDVTFTVADDRGNALPGSGWVLGGASGVAGEPKPLTPTQAPVTVTPPGRASMDVPVTIPSGPPVTIPLVYPIPRGSLLVRATDNKGNALADADWLAPNESAAAFPAGVAAEREAGTVHIVARAPGYRSVERDVVVKADTVEEIVFQLEPSRAGVAKERIDIREVVNFETNKDVILPSSFPLLDDVADVLRSHPELTLVRIEGHTDSRGNDAANFELSSRRAASVMRALVERGIQAGRLQAEGFGETRPLVKEKSDADRAKNRRVEFFVVERVDAP
jgi:outer membrane protein OmpA-like peptidoglycan-associated protein